MKTKKRKLDPTFITQLRKDLDWSQETLSNFFRVSFRTIQNWELALASPNEFQIAVLQRLREKLNNAPQRQQFEQELENLLPKIIFGEGAIVLLEFLFT